MSTLVKYEKAKAFTAVDATPLDGTTATRTYKRGDRLNSACLLLEEGTDAVIVYISGAGSANNTMVFNLYGYGLDGDAERIYMTVTATLGTGVAGTGLLYADTIVGTDKHTSTIGIYDSADNSICKFKFDTQGLNWLYFEPVTFTTMTACTFHVREVGQK